MGLVRFVIDNLKQGFYRNLCSAWLNEKVRSYTFRVIIYFRSNSIISK